MSKEVTITMNLYAYIDHNTITISVVLLNWPERYTSTILSHDNKQYLFIVTPDAFVYYTNDINNFLCNLCSIAIVYIANLQDINQCIQSVGEMENL